MRVLYFDSFTSVLNMSFSNNFSPNAIEEDLFLYHKELHYSEIGSFWESTLVKKSSSLMSIFFMWAISYFLGDSKSS